MALNIRKHFGDKKFYKMALLIALPVMGRALIQNLVTLIDNFMVAGLGDIKTGGVNVAGQLMFVFNIMITAICTSGGIFLTQFFGAKSKEGMKKAFVFKIFLGLIIFVFYILCTTVWSHDLLLLLLNQNTQTDLILI